MKKLILTSALLLALSTSQAFAATAHVNVNGLVCDFCARAIEKVFSKQDAVQDIDVNLESKVITIHFKDGQNLDDETITTLITDSGYNVEEINRDE